MSKQDEDNRKAMEVFKSCGAEEIEEGVIVFDLATVMANRMKQLIAGHNANERKDTNE